MINNGKYLAKLPDFLRYLFLGLLICGVITCWNNSIVGNVDRTYRMYAESIDQRGDFLSWDMPEYNDLLLNYFTPAGNMPFHHMIGRSLVSLPFYWILRFFSSWLPLPEIFSCSFRELYISAYNLGGLLASMGAVYSMYRICRMSVSRWLSIVVTVLTVGSSYFVLLLLLHHGGAEGPLMLIICALLWYSSRIDRLLSSGYPGWFLMGILSGLLPLFRLQGIVYVVVPLSVWLSMVYRRRYAKKQSIFVLLIFLGGVGIGIIPLLLYQHYYYGIFGSTYNVGFSQQRLGDLLQFFWDYSPQLLHNPIMLVGLLSISLLWSKSPGVTIGGFLIILSTGALMVLYIGYQGNFWLGSRFNLFLVPLASMGLAELIFRLSRSWRIVAFVVFGLILFCGPFARNMGEFCLFLRKYHPMEWIIVNRADSLPPFRSPVEIFRWLPTYATNIVYILIGVKMATSSFFPIVSIIPGSLLLLMYSQRRWVHQHRKSHRNEKIVIIVVLIFSIYSSLILITVGKTNQKHVHQLEQQGFYRNTWRTMLIDPADESSLAGDRGMYYLSKANFAAATRQYYATMLNVPGGRRFFSILNTYRREHGIKNHIFQDLQNYGIRSAVVPFTAGKRGGEVLFEEAFDRRFDTSVRLVPIENSGGPLELILDMDTATFSDLYIVFGSDKMAGQLRVQLGNEVTAWPENVPTDEIRSHDRPPSTNIYQLADTVWIVDLYKRPFRYLRLYFPAGQSEIHIREIFAVMSPRHATHRY